MTDETLIDGRAAPTAVPEFADDLADLHRAIRNIQALSELFGGLAPSAPLRRPALTVIEGGRE
jgi:hypothetical protein